MKHLLNGPLKDFLRTTKDGGIQSAWGFLLSPRIRAILPSLVQAFPLVSVEVHILTGRSRLTMAFWMIASWILSTKRNWQFIIHDDGSFRHEDVFTIQKLIPSCRVILSVESTPRMTQWLAGRPSSLKCRNLHPLGRKLFDFPLYSKSDRFISIDTDVLFFKTPERLVKWGIESEPECIFMEDIQDSSLLNLVEVQNLFGVHLVPKVNTGIIAMPTAALSLDVIEACLNQTSILANDPWYVEQTLYAVAASVYGRSELLAKPYIMSLDRICPTEAIARHYIGAIRHLFYSEGMPRVAASLRQWQQTTKLNK